jgi:hypothetical protein
MAAYKFVHVYETGDVTSVYHFRKSLKHADIQSYSIEPFVYALRSVNYIWPSLVKLVRILSISLLNKIKVYEFTGRTIGSSIEYFEIDQYDTTYEDDHFLNTDHKITVYANSENAMAPITKVSLTDASVTDEMFKHGVPLADIPGWSDVTIESYLGLTQRQKNDTLLMAAQTGNVIWVKQLLAAGADVHYFE